MEPEPAEGMLPHQRLDDLLAELQSRLQIVLRARDQMRGRGRCRDRAGPGVRVAADRADGGWPGGCQLRRARGDREGRLLAEFIPVGLTESEIAAIDHWPEGRGLLIHDPRPLRLAGIAAHPDSSGFPVGHPPMGSFPPRRHRVLVRQLRPASLLNLPPAAPTRSGCRCSRIVTG
jgi:hypothetical protein